MGKNLGHNMFREINTNMIKEDFDDDEDEDEELDEVNELESNATTKIDDELNCEDAVDFIDRHNAEQTALRLKEKRKNDRIKLLINSKDKQLRVKEDDEISKVSSSVLTKNTSKSKLSAIRKERDLLKQIGQKVGGSGSNDNNINSKLNELTKKKNLDIESRSIHSKLSKTGSLARAKSMASLQSNESSLST